MCLFPPEVIRHFREQAVQSGTIAMPTHCYQAKKQLCKPALNLSSLFSSGPATAGELSIDGMKFNHMNSYNDIL
jgi:hypothetical protein